MDSGGPLFPWLQWGKNTSNLSQVFRIGNLVIDQADTNNLEYSDYERWTGKCKFSRQFLDKTIKRIEGQIVQLQQKRLKRY